MDGSVALAWCFHDEVNTYADDVAAAFPKSTAIVPSLWHLEIANAFVTAERQRRSTSTDTSNWTAFLSGLPITVDDETIRRAWNDVIGLARTHRLSSYDAAYLELADRHGLPLATIDKKLKSAARSAGITEYQP